MKTIGRNRKKFIDELFAKGQQFRSYSLCNNFRGVEVTGEWVRKQFDTFPFAKLQERSPGHYMLTLHSNLWYEFHLWYEFQVPGEG